MELSDIIITAVGCGAFLLIALIDFVFFKITGKRLSDLKPPMNSDINERLEELEEAVKYTENAYKYEEDWLAIQNLGNRTYIIYKNGAVVDAYSADMEIVSYDNNTRTMTLKEKRK